jgi:hypothetical protein
LKNGIKLRRQWDDASAKNGEVSKDWTVRTRKNLHIRLKIKEKPIANKSSIGHSA